MPPSGWPSSSKSRAVSFSAGALPELARSITTTAWRSSVVRFCVTPWSTFAFFVDDLQFGIA